MSNYPDSDYKDSSEYDNMPVDQDFEEHLEDDWYKQQTERDAAQRLAFDLELEIVNPTYDLPF